jgi:hypothetical protein
MEALAKTLGVIIISAVSIEESFAELYEKIVQLKLKAQGVSEILLSNWLMLLKA